MAGLYPKKIAGKTYWYLREMARVDGKPKMVSERYLGPAAEVEALLEAREQAVRHEVPSQGEGCGVAGDPEEVRDRTALVALPRPGANASFR